MFVALGLGVGAALFGGSPFLALLTSPFAGVLTLLFVARRQEIGAALAMAALDRAARGRFDEARALLDAVSKNVLSSYVGMMVDSQRAALALYEGQLDIAVAEATKGARQDRRRLRAIQRIHQGSALSIRAVALAGLGRREEALADIASVRGAEYRQAAFLARASLAEALVFARDKDFESLARVLRDDRSLLLGATGPRERMIVRALARMVAAKKISVYREPAKRDEQDLDENASWVARIAPEAASYARAPKLGTRLEAPRALDPKALANAEKTAPKAKVAVKRMVALWALLVVLFGAIWSLLGDVGGAAASASASAAHDGSSTALLLAASVAAVGAAVGFFAFRIARAQKLTVALGRAMELRHRGQIDEARSAFRELAKSSVALVAPQAQRELAAIAAAAGDFETARRHAESGILAAHVSTISLSLSRPVLLPQLHGELAFALAASGNVALAEEELAKLPALFPSYPYLARDTFRVRLVGLTASGKLDEAATMARERPPDLPLSMQEELLCDAVRIGARDVLPEGERERIELDLRDDVAAGRFLDCVAPALRARVHERQVGGGPRVAVGADPPHEASAPDEATEPETEELRRMARHP
jgi:hypothetical protein